MTRGEFDRALIAFAMRVEAEAEFFIDQQVNHLDDELPREENITYMKRLTSILRGAEGLRKTLLYRGRYLTDEERARILDTSSLDELLKKR